MQEKLQISNNLWGIKSKDLSVILRISQKSAIEKIKGKYPFTTTELNLIIKWLKLDLIEIPMLITHMNNLLTNYKESVKNGK